MKRVFIISLILILLLALVSAAIITYVSNTATANFSSKFPIYISLSSDNGSTWSASNINLGQYYLGESSEAKINITNLANVDVININLTFELSNDVNNLSCSYLSDARLYTGNWVDLNSSCIANNNLLMMKYPFNITKLSQLIYNYSMILSLDAPITNYTLNVKATTN